MTQDHFEDKFKSMAGFLKQKDVPLSGLSSYRAGGVARTVWYPVTAVELSVLIDYFRCVDEDYWILGGGANTIFDDGYIETALVSTGKLNKIQVDGNKIYAEAGVILDGLVRESIGAGLAGLEKLSGIPGTVGGALWMNAGAYGSEIGDKVVCVTVIEDGAVKTLSREDCDFTYRSSKGLKNAVVIAAEWQLEKGDVVSLRQSRSNILKGRAEKQPLEFPSCGSVFKRPEGDYASRLIDAAGLKGVSIGGAQVSEKHAGFIINRDEATAADILALIKHCQAVVKEKFGVELELEQQLLRK